MEKIFFSKHFYLSLAALSESNLIAGITQKASSAA